MKAAKFIRHGDVYLVQSNKKVAGKRTGNNSPVLALGEVTGHSHRLNTMEGVERFEIDGVRFLQVSADGISISHEEHGTLDIPPGLYEERIDREYDYSANAIRNVAD
jgi:hypothetical protein